jgi:hypothetical protein
VQSPCLEMAVCGNLLAKLHRERAWGIPWHHF